MFVKIGLESISPITLAAGRITIGAIIMILLSLKMGIKFPQKVMEWFHCMIVGITGIIIPFILINSSIQYVHSSLAAICMSLSPLFTITLSHYMTHDEKFSKNKLFGIIFGILGVISLFYGAITDINNSPEIYLALLGLVASSFFYALSGVLIKKLKNKNPISTSSAMLITASLIIIPLALIIEKPWMLQPTSSAIYAVFVLGIFATGIASLVLFHLTHLAGATFVSYSAYLIPLIGMAAGNIWLDEPLKIHYTVSVLFIFSGIYLAEKKKTKSKIL